MCFGDSPSESSADTNKVLPGYGSDYNQTTDDTPVSTPSVLETMSESEISATDVADVERSNAELRGDNLEAETNEQADQMIAQARAGGAPKVSDPLGGAPDETAGARQLETAEMSGANWFTRDMAVGQSHPPSSTTGKGSLDYTMQRYNLPGDVASSIAFNPGSDYSTKGEKALATAQIILPGGGLVGGVRTLGMMGGRSTGGTPDNNNGGQNTPPVLPKKIRLPSIAPKVSQKKSATQVSALQRFPEGSTVPFPQFRGQSSSIVSPRFRGGLDDDDGFGINRNRIGGIA